MRIAAVEAMVLSVPDVRIIGDGAQDTLVVRVVTDDGIEGIGESTAMPYVTKAIVEARGSQIAARGLAELLVGEDAGDIESLWQRMYDLTTVYGRRGVTIHAISAVDMALWDVLGKARGLPVAELLGRSLRRTVRVYASALFPEDRTAALDVVRDLVARGFSAVKLGWGPLGGDVDQDLAAVAEVRETVGAGVDLMVDLGMPIALEDAIALSRGLRDLGVLFLEEPLSPDDLDGYRLLSQSGGATLAAGEKLTSRHEFADFVAQVGHAYLQPDVGRVGGLTEARRVAELAAQAGCPIVPHCWASDVLGAASAHFVAGLSNAPLLEYCVQENPLRSGLVQQPLKLVDGFIEIPDAPGLGVTLDPAVVDQLRVA
jgi:L-alanine-DL-glutamate epimerase-like enolase superfamily enzyme